MDDFDDPPPSVALDVARRYARGDAPPTPSPDHYWPGQLSGAPEPSWHDKYVKPWGSVALARSEPNWFGKNVLANIPPETMLAMQFLGRAGPRASADAIAAGGPSSALGAGPSSFLEALRSRDIPAGKANLRWNPQQEWFDVLHEGKPIGRTFVTPVNAKTGYTENPDAFILGPRLEDAYRRQGIGTSIYDTLSSLGEQHGMRMVPGLDLSRAAFNLWRKRDPDLLVESLGRPGSHAKLTTEEKAWLAARGEKPSHDPFKP